MVEAVGIDDLNIYASTLAIDYADIAAVRDFPESLLHSVRFHRRSLLPPYEDPITMAVNAAKPVVEAANPNDFELLIVATETGIDYAKPISSYVHHHLGLSASCSNFEIKHACYAGTAAMQMAVAWVRSAIAPGKRALVVTTDIGRRHFNDPAELSVGAGAVALSISEHPRLFALEPMRGYASRETYDTARPTADSEWIDAPLSVASYLDLVDLAWESYRAVASRCAGAPAHHAQARRGMLNGDAISGDSISFSQHFAYIIYHTPFVSLIERAHQLLLETESEFLTSDEAAARFEEMVSPSLSYNRELGNIYSGSMYVALAGLIENAPVLNATTRIGGLSYGSGSCAEFFSGFAGKDARQIIASHALREQLAARRKTNVAEYEKLTLAVEQNLVSQNYEPDWKLLPGHYADHYQGKNLLVLEGIHNHYRSYKWS